MYKQREHFQDFQLLINMFLEVESIKNFELRENVDENCL